jgi:ParB family chromosome partitioning protein
VQEGWSVRALESRAREASSSGGRGRSRSGSADGGLHPDQIEAAARIADALSAALGREVRVRARGDGYRVEIDVATLDDGLDLARKVRPRVAA